MLGKQWLNRYDSADIRGTAIQRSQNRQRKQDGMVGWSFENVMGLLPLMLQGALLLFGCALSRYLWGVDVTVASVVLGVTSAGVLWYLFIVIAGTASESCPYQTPGSHILRHHILPPLRSTPSKIWGFIKTSRCCDILIRLWYQLKDISSDTIPPIKMIVLVLTVVFRDVVPRLLAGLSGIVHRRFMATSIWTRDPAQRTIILDLRCVSWMLQTSLNRSFHLTALKYLAEMPELPSFGPNLVVGCFDILTSCISAGGGTLVMVQGLEQLATLSASCFLRALRYSLVTDPTSSALADLRQRYNKSFPSGWVDFADLPFRYTMMVTRALVDKDCRPPRGQRWWDDDRPFPEEHVQLAGCIVEVAQVEHRKNLPKKVPRWTLRFALDSLSLDPPPSPSVVADCLKVIAIDLGCDVSNIRTGSGRCVRI